MFNKILVPIDVDYPKTAAAVYQKAAALAKMSEAEIKLVSVMPGFGMPIVASYITEEVRKEAAEKFKSELANRSLMSSEPESTGKKLSRLPINGELT